MHIVILSEANVLMEAVVEQFRGKDATVSVLHIQDVQANDEWIKASLETIVDKNGPIDGFLYLVESSDFDEIIPFLFAKNISRYFHRSAHPSRKAFVIAVSLDGAFGLNNRNNWAPETGALTGLVKTLHQEWPWVFTRIIDFAPEMDITTVSEQLLTEWTDADSRLVEIGITNDARYTIDYKIITEIQV